jgi:hypothetical protein
VAKPLLLIRADHFERMAVVQARAHLHLAKDEARAAADDKVDLASSDPHVRAQNPVAANAVVEAGAALGGPSSD